MRRHSQTLGLARNVPKWLGNWALATRLPRWGPTHTHPTVKGGATVITVVDIAELAGRNAYYY